MKKFLSYLESNLNKQKMAQAATHAAVNAEMEAAQKANADVKLLEDRAARAKVLLAEVDAEVFRKDKATMALGQKYEDNRGLDAKCRDVETRYGGGLGTAEGSAPEP